MAELDQVIQAAVARQDAPFLVAMTGNSDGVMWSGCAGQRSPGQPATLDTVFRIFSMTKAVGSMAAMILIDRGQLSADTEVEVLLPEFAGLRVLDGFDGSTPRLRAPRTKATVRHLATHTSGLVYEFWNADVPRYMEAAGHPTILSGLVASMNYPLMFEPGTRWDYGVGVDWLGRVTTASLKAAWAQKWLVHRRLRPEAFAGRVHQTKMNVALYPVHPDLLKSAALEKTHQRFGSYLLPQAYPEGSPIHPSYPGGHATVAGACSVVLKALFEENALMPDCVHASADGLRLEACPPEFVPTIGTEIDKLVCNIAMARSWAGIHYRSDSTAGARLGEDVAISILQDLVRTCTEEFEGFAFTRLDGTRVRIERNGEVRSG